MEVRQHGCGVHAGTTRCYPRAGGYDASADAMVGNPMVNVRDIETGKVRATRELMGAD